VVAFDKGIFMIENWKARFSDNIREYQGYSIGKLLDYLTNPEIISLAGGLPSPDMFLKDEIRDISQRRLDEDIETILQYTPVRGEKDFIQALIQFLKRDNIDVSEENIVITAAGQFSISESGSLAYVSGGMVPNLKNLLVWVDHDGNVKPISSQIRHYFAPRLSSDGNRILYSTLGTKQIVGVYDIDRDINSTIITGGDNIWPLFSPKENAIVFSRQESSAHSDIFTIAAIGDTKMKRLITSQYTKYPSSFSPDGNLLAYIESKNSNDILIYDFRDESSTAFAATEYEENYPEFSPDGRWIAYCTNEEGRSEVYVRHSSGTGETIKVSRDGGRAPLWARSGKKLFYLSLDYNQVWASDVLSETRLSFGSPRFLFVQSKLQGSVPVRGYDISLDDQRFLAVQREDRQPQPVTEINLIQNWFEELKRLVPTRKK